MPRVVRRAALPPHALAAMAENAGAAETHGGAGEGGGGTAPGETGPAREVEAAEDGGSAPPPTGEGDGTAEGENTTDGVEAGAAYIPLIPPMEGGDGSPRGEKAPEEPKAESASPASPPRKRDADESSPASSPKKKQKRNRDDGKGGKSGGNPTTMAPPPPWAMLPPGAWMAQRTGMLLQQTHTARRMADDLIRQMASVNQLMSDLQEKHRRILAKAKPQAELIASLKKENASFLSQLQESRKENKSLTRELEKCKTKLLESKENKEKASRKAQEDRGSYVKYLQGQIQKQKEKTKEEKEKCKQMKKELKDHQRTVQFNQCTKLQRPGDEGRPQNHIDHKWRQKYELLKRFRERHGHCNCTNHVPGSREEYPGLATWVQSQRTGFNRLRAGRKTNLTPLRIKHLNDVGFVWQPTGQDWLHFDQRIPQLQAFKEEHGHTNVQQQYKGIHGLGNWVLTMRRNYREGKLAQERIDVLEAMGFQWRLRSVKVPGGRHNRHNHHDQHNAG